jgi:hypothetical protein
MQTPEKRYKLVPRTNLDINYVGGMHDTITYSPDDQFIETDEELIVAIINPKTSKTLEHIVCLKRNMLSYRFQDVMFKVEDKSTPPIEVGAPTGD